MQHLVFADDDLQDGKNKSCKEWMGYEAVHLFLPLVDQVLRPSFSGPT